jgi:DNA-binding transcriptional regulator YhcF (GntR family)
VSWAINERLDVEGQVVCHLYREIARGAWSPGDPLPAPHVVAQETILNPRTVESAFSRLAQVGVLTATSGGDFIVAGDAQELARGHLEKSVKGEIRDLVTGLRGAGFGTEDIQRIWKEATDD